MSRDLAVKCQAHLRQLAKLQRRAMVVLLVFLGSIPAFIFLLSILVPILDPGHQHPYPFLGAFLAVQLLLYAVMATINYRFGKLMDVPWVPKACIATVLMPAIALVALFILSKKASTELESAGIKMGFLGADPTAIDLLSEEA